MDHRAAGLWAGSGANDLGLLILLLTSLGGVGPLPLLVALIPAAATGVLIGKGTAPPLE